MISASVHIDAVRFDGSDFEVNARIGKAHFLEKASLTLENVGPYEKTKDAIGQALMRLKVKDYERHASHLAVGVLDNTIDSVWAIVDIGGVNESR